MKLTTDEKITLANVFTQFQLRSMENIAKYTELNDNNEFTSTIKDTKEMLSRGMKLYKKLWNNI